MREIGWEQLMGRFVQKARGKPQIVKVMVELTYGCNLRCVHCYNPTHQARGELTTKQVLKILDDLQTEGSLHVGFTGGELFTRNDAGAILRYAKQLGFVINILTNATLITPSLADQIREINPYLVEVSVYGATAGTYESVTRVPGSFGKFVKGVDLLSARNVPVMLKLVLMTLNAHELEAMKAFAKIRRLRYKFSTEILPKVDGSLEPLSYRLPPDRIFEIWRKEVGQGIRDFAMESGNNGREEAREREGCGRHGTLFACGCGKSQAAITPHGKLNLCLSVYQPLYDLTKGSMKKGWQNLVRMVAQARPRPRYECPDCSLSKYCTRGVGD
ncbi:MAG: radical SAM protein, partial [Deltaproteobacteria bacterium]|nr:radical SAM protein [Deltaproteobacteria bacterium]